MNWKKTLLICILILATAIVGIVVIYLTEPTASRTTATKKTAMLVDVETAARGTYQPVIEVMGTVVPEQEIELSPRVSGEIIALSESFTPGGFVEKGETLVTIDPADYEAMRLERKSSLRQTMADLEMELGRQDVAKQDYELLEQALSSENKALVLREPQLNTAQARVEAARASLRRAELDLERTEIKAPFAAHIISRAANVGTIVSPGHSLGHLVATGTYWIEAAVPVSKLPWIQFPGDEPGEASLVKIYSRSARPGEYREGRIHRLIAALEPDTRLARVLVDVEDPLARTEQNAGKAPLMIGSFVQINIVGEALENVVRIKRDHLRQNNTIWTMEDGRLKIHEAEILFRDREYAYIGDGIPDQVQIVTTNLSTVVDGAELRLQEEEK